MFVVCRLLFVGSIGGPGRHCALGGQGCPGGQGGPGGPGGPDGPGDPDSPGGPGGPGGPVGQGGKGDQVCQCIWFTWSKQSNY